MSKGYWGPRIYSCPDCHSGPKEKFWCRACDHVAKAPVGGSPRCPSCRELMENMGHRWRPGKKGKRTRKHKDPRSLAQRRAAWYPESPGLVLLRRLESVNERR